MLKSIQSILFATDLTENCQPALDFTLSIATRFKATVYMLHVIEKLPDGVDGKLKTLLGPHQWGEMVASHKEHAHKSLLGKQSTNSAVREAINKFCMQEGFDGECSFEAHEIIISDDGIVESILENAQENDCDLIVIGGHHSSMFSKTALSNTAKKVLKQSKIPVTVVPALDS
jgi:nucleotide-binding universal stress UspA family protein